jgi:Concanavalin A-like lectin/glucanases superfamily
LIFTQVAEMNMNLNRCCFFAVVTLAGFLCESSFAVPTGVYLLDNSAADTSGLGHSGTIEGGSTFGSGLYMGSAGALVQNADGQSVTLPPGTDFIRNAPGATLMAWVRPDAISGTGANTILVVNNGNTGSTTGIGDARAIIQVNAGTFRALGRVGDADSSVFTTGGTPVVGQTAFVAGVFDYAGSAIRLYVDGQQVGSNTSIAGWGTNSADTANLAARIGSHANGTQEYWRGAIDGARIFNTALTASEILDIYNAETFPPPLPGDTDGDGVVEPEDLTPIRMNWRQTGKTRMEGNLTGDAAGLVDFADFRQWKTAILAGGGSLDGIDLSFTSVPEPSAMLLVLSGVALGVCGGRRNMRHVRVAGTRLNCRT